LFFLKDGAPDWVMEGSMRKILFAVAALAFSVFTPSAASALVEGKKVALVIGNSAYAHAVTLPNPVSDSKLIGETLRKAGFSVIDGSDLNKVDMGRLLDEFTEAAYDADVAVVYYAGHGLQVDGRNYLIPIDAELQKAAQLQTRTIPVDDVLAALPPDPAVGVIILDACRDNPLARTLAAALPVSRSSSMGAGLAPVLANGVTHDAGGLLIAYATDPGAVAYDGKEAHSPYTTALAKHLTTPGLEIQSALTRVRAEVSEVTAGAQRPWHNASLAREVFIGGNAPEAKSPPPQGAIASTPQSTGESGVDWTVEQKLWDEASKRNTIAHYELYLSEFPEGRFASIARLNLDQLKEAGAVQTASAGTTGEAGLASASQVRTAVVVPDDVKKEPGTAETEALLELDRQGKIDLQLRLSAVGHSTGGFDGSIGPRSRKAIAAWQRQNGIVETTYLTPRQHLFLVAETDPLMAQVRARYESEKAAAEKAAAAKRQAPQKVVKTTTKKKSQQAATTTTRKKPTQTANDDIPYKPRPTTGGSQPTKVDDGSSAAGSFAAGALLGTALGVAIGNRD
jgi:uncharacterized caspase-like protein